MDIDRYLDRLEDGASLLGRLLLAVVVWPVLLASILAFFILTLPFFIAGVFCEYTGIHDKN